ncbi:hypothetical protein D5F01_LYC22751 [Larimichthys crocea]|uniref:Uncharacterized protein n=1 Tax=Larimichthys crocea TaxID=215358 RepID=A0A6G0HIZ3_LARCR|nr:hypothetical protein D5F01_LYC22751 [Larimichthys crocea]
MGPPAKIDIPPIPLHSSPRSARTGPIKTGGRVFVLDHKRWTSAMKEAIDSLLNKHRGQKDMLKLVDQDYAAMVHQSATDPNSLFHPTTKHHIIQYTKYLAKQTQPLSQQKRMKAGLLRVHGLIRAGGRSAAAEAFEMLRALCSCTITPLPIPARRHSYAFQTESQVTKAAGVRDRGPGGGGEAGQGDWAAVIVGKKKVALGCGLAEKE